MKKRFSIISSALAFICTVVFNQQTFAGLVIYNPYNGVTTTMWNNWYKANLHTHSNVNSDVGSLSPSNVAALYKNNGYSILSITGQSVNSSSQTTTWTPPSGMISISGAEIVNDEYTHMGCLFTAYHPNGTEPVQILTSLSTSANIIMNHPGRYVGTAYEHSTQYYLDLFLKFSNLKAIEVFDAVGTSRGENWDYLWGWDQILKLTIPVKHVWGVANDDMHTGTDDMGLCWNVFPIASLTSTNVNNAFAAGAFVFCDHRNATSAEPPKISNITLSGTTVTISASGQNEIDWISNNGTIATGSSYDLTSSDNQYVRAEIHGDGGVTYTQPFELVYQISNQIELNDVRNHTACNFKVMNDISLSGSWEPIGFFRGSFNGNGKKITNLTINRPDDWHVGLFGDVWGGFVYNLGVTINGSITGGKNTGGLAGYNSGIIEKCYATGGSVANSGTVDEANIGGLVGCLANGTIIKSYSSSAVSALTSGSYINKTGGLVGYNEQGDILNCYATGSVAGKTAGGLVGSNGYYRGIIDTCYSTGSVNGTITAGGLIGIQNSSANTYRSYWDTQTSGKSTSAGGSGAMGRNTTQMKTQSNYSGWSFTYVWNLVSGSYPTIKW